MIAEDVLGQSGSIRLGEDRSSLIGVNAIASFAATTGLAEAARRTITALLAAGVDVSLVDFDYGAPREIERFPRSMRRLPRGQIHDVTITFININEMHTLSDAVLRGGQSSRYVVGSWYWELPSIPTSMESEIGRVDEIWTASRFVRDAFRARTLKTVKVIPCVVEPAIDESLTRRDFGIDQDTCVCLFSFDINSTLARKNPFAVVDAFRRAVPAAQRGREVTLLMKSINLDSAPEARFFLEREVASVGGRIINDDLSAGEMGALLSLCDIYISLHRAEGFGLGIAESMYFGRPVVATAYSGNMDFMTATNSCPISYRLVPVSVEELRFNPGSEQVYEPGQVWADPDVELAARRLRFLIDHPEVRERIGQRASADIRGRYGSKVVGAEIRSMLMYGATENE